MSLLLGEDVTGNLTNKKVLVVGVGGVGGYAAENIARAGIGNMYLLDGDKVDITNCNRQIIALSSTVNHAKAEVSAQRCREINPSGNFIALEMFLKTPEDISRILDENFDFVIDAIDDVQVKLELIRQLKERNIPFITSMGAGGKLDPSQIMLADISKTYGCPLARVIRSKLKKMNIYKGVPVVFSPEQPSHSFESKKIGSISYIPAVFGCFCASAAIRKLISD
jgi:tRNA A37 threonylcarbamoyladenosine dehydratase